MNVSQLYASVERQHKPEGISIMVNLQGITWEVPDASLVEVARLIAEVLHPDVKVRPSMQALYIGRDEFEEGIHEVVLEVHE